MGVSPVWLWLFQFLFALLKVDCQLLPFFTPIKSHHSPFCLLAWMFSGLGRSDPSFYLVLILCVKQESRDSDRLLKVKGWCGFMAPLAGLRNSHWEWLGCHHCNCMQTFRSFEMIKPLIQLTRNKLPGFSLNSLSLVGGWGGCRDGLGKP